MTMNVSVWKCLYRRVRIRLNYRSAMRTSEMQGNSTKNAENYRTVCQVVESLANIMYRKEYAFEYVV